MSAKNVISFVIVSNQISKFENSLKSNISFKFNYDEIRINKLYNKNTIEINKQINRSNCIAVFIT